MSLPVHDVLVSVSLSWVVHLNLCVLLLRWHRCCLSLSARSWVIDEMSEDVADIPVGSWALAGRVMRANRLHLGTSSDSISFSKFLHSRVVLVLVDVASVHVSGLLVEATDLALVGWPDLTHVLLSLLGNLFSACSGCIDVRRATVREHFLAIAAHSQSGTLLCPRSRIYDVVFHLPRPD